MPKKKSGAPKGNQNAKKFIDWELIDNLLNIGCIGEEIARVLGVDYDTIANQCKKKYGILFSDYIKKGNEEFRVSLKRIQYRSAFGIRMKSKEGNTLQSYLLKPSVTMQIWMGKQYLGQSDKQEINHIDLPEGVETTII